MTNRLKCFLPQWIYETHLKTIHNVRFTRREIDILSCIANGRNTGTTATLLGISPRTVDTHLQNVMSRLDCNSRQSVLKFLSKSGQSSWLHHYYISLLAQEAFEQGLKQLSLHVKKKSLTGVIFYWVQDAEQKIFLIQLKEHLERSGINISLKNTPHASLDPRLYSPSFRKECSYS